MSALNQLEEFKLMLTKEEQHLGERIDEIKPFLTGEEIPEEKEEFEYIRAVYSEISQKLVLMPKLISAVIGASSQVPGGTAAEISRTEKLCQQCTKLKSDLEAKFPFVKSAPKTATALYGAAHGAAAAAAASEDMFQPQ